MRTLITILTLLLVSLSSFSAQRSKKQVKQKSPEEERVDMLYATMLPNTQNLFIIDSLVTDVDSVWKEIPYPSSMGKVIPYNDFFGTDNQAECYVYVNGFGDKCYYSEMSSDSTSCLYVRYKINGEWAQPKRITGLGNGMSKMNHPFMTSDGVTLYFSAISEEALGGYDIFVTSYDAEDDTFFKADNIGLPFNSTADDILYIEDDIDKLAWLATTRRQPEGKACIYTIALSETRTNYDQDYMEDEELKNLAAITCIADTWSSEEQRNAAMNRLMTIRSKQTGKAPAQEICFNINGETIHLSINELLTKEDKQRYETLAAKIKQYDDAATALYNMRTQYNSSTEATRKSMTANILEAEQSLESLNNEIANSFKALKSVGKSQ